MKTYKKLLSVFLAVLMLLSVLPLTAFGADIVASGGCDAMWGDDGVTWTLDSNGIFTISGTGYMVSPECEQYSVPWHNYIKDIVAVNVSEGIKGCLVTFSGYTNLERITVDPRNQYLCSDEYGVLFNKEKTTLWEYPAAAKSTYYEIPFGVRWISSNAFDNCSYLQNVKIPSSISEIGYRAFSGCKSLRRIEIPNSVTKIQVYAFQGCTNITDVYYSGTEEQWGKIDFGSINYILNATIHYNSELTPINYIYNIGEETYRFENFVDDDSYGHCFGMSATSSGYYLGLLNKSNIGLSDSDSLYSLGLNETVKAPICYYQEIQGIARDNSIVAGGSYYKSFPFYIYNAKADWEELVDYVKNHEHDNAGDLIIAYTKKSEGGHAINFLRYEVVDGQERIYAYDSNFPDKETYFYQDVNDYIRQAVRSTFSGSIDCLALVDVRDFFSRARNFVMAKTFYAPANSITIEGAYASPMCVSGTTEEIMMYEILNDDTEVIITPLVENATFTYMGNEYTFDEINEDTYAEFTLSESEEDEPVFEIVNAPSQECEHSYEEVRTEPTCTETGSIVYTCYCGDTYSETIAALGHTEEIVNEKVATATTDGYTGDTICSVCGELIESGKVIPATGTPVNNCDHMCHKSGFVGFIWKIVQFFWKLFNMNPVCECGVAHY